MSTDGGMYGRRSGRSGVLRRLRRVALGCIKVSCLSLPMAVAATDAPAVVQVAGRELGAEAVHEAMRQLPEFQLRALGGTPAEIKAAFVEEYLLPDLRLALEAERQELEASIAFQAKRDDILVRALVEELRREVEANAPVSEAQARRYYDEHQPDFVTPERIHVWRILVGDEALARSIIQRAKSGQIEAWSKLAQEHSLDKATYLRNGDVGMVRPDGHTDVPRVRVQPELFAAVKEVSDGQILDAPVKLGAHYAAVWRRGSLPEVRESFEQAQAHIERVLLRERLTTELDKLLKGLRAKHVRELKPDLVTAVELRFDVGPRAKTPSPQASDPSSAGVPRAGDDGLR